MICTLGNEMTAILSEICKSWWCKKNMVTVPSCKQTLTREYDTGKRKRKQDFKVLFYKTDRYKLLIKMADFSLSTS